MLDPVADRFSADLYLPTGEISDTLVYTMASRMVPDDGRPMVVFYFADCDPAGWQMPISVSPQAAGAQGARVRRPRVRGSPGRR